MRHTVALTLCLLLAACGEHQVRIPPPPEVVRVPVDRIVGVPADLTTRMDPGTPQAQDYHEAKRLALVRLQVIMAGNCRFLRIISLAQPLDSPQRAEWAANQCEGMPP